MNLNGEPFSTNLFTYEEQLVHSLIDYLETPYVKEKYTAITHSLPDEILSGSRSSFRTLMEYVQNCRTCVLPGDHDPFN